VNPISWLRPGRKRPARVVLLPLAAGVAALLSAVTLGATAGEAGVVVAVAVGLWLWLGTVRSRVEESRLLALTDDLTGLGNRRRLLGDLECAIDEGTDHSPSALAMFAWHAGRKARAGSRDDVRHLRCTDHRETVDEMRPHDSGRVAEVLRETAVADFRLRPPDRVNAPLLGCCKGE